MCPRSYKHNLGACFYRPSINRDYGHHSECQSSKLVSNDTALVNRSFELAGASLWLPATQSPAQGPPMSSVMLDMNLGP